MCNRHSGKCFSIHFIDSQRARTHLQQSVAHSRLARVGPHLTRQTHLIILQLFAQRLFAYQIKEGTIATEARKAGKLGKTAKQTNAKSIRSCSSKIREQFLSIIFEVCFALGAQILYKCCNCYTDNEHISEKDSFGEHYVLYKLPLNLMALITIHSYFV